MTSLGRLVTRRRFPRKARHSQVFQAAQQGRSLPRRGSQRGAKRHLPLDTGRGIAPGLGALQSISLGSPNTHMGVSFFFGGLSFCQYLLEEA